MSFLESYDPKQDPIVNELGSQLTHLLPFTPVTAVGLKRLIAKQMFLGRLPAAEGLYGDIGSIADSIYTSPVFFIEPDMGLLIEQLAWKIKQAGLSTVPKKLPFQSVFLTAPPRGFSVDIETTNGRLKLNQCWAKLVGHCTTNGAPVTCFFDLLEDKFTLYALEPEQAFIDALCLFIEEKIAVVRQQKIPRAFCRNKGIREQEIIRTITLRSAEYAEGGEVESSSVAQRSYACQWIVRGHPRAQWYPSEQVNKLIWIDPYKKGPEGAPFVEAVRHVRR